MADLLKARSGVYHPARYETATNAAARPARGSYRPGTFWYKVRIADPIGMEDFRAEHGRYVRGPDSIHAAYPFWMTARDMARFGLLYLRHGQWRGTPVVPREWIEESTHTYSDFGQKGGYGYMWYVAPAGGPHLDLVVVHRVNTAVEGRQVTESRFGHLMQLILDAAST